MSFKMELMIGPRGVARTSSTASAAFLTRIVSRRTSHGNQASPWRYSHTPLVWRICSRNRSALSESPAVTPQAEWPLCPHGTVGDPKNVAPVMVSVGVRMVAKYHGAGMMQPRCGSLHKIGRPVVERAAATTQLFDPPAGGITSLSAAMSSRNRSIIAIPPACGMPAPGTVPPVTSASEGSSASNASGPSASRIRRRASSQSQLEAMNHGCNFMYDSTSAGSQGVGVRPKTTNSCGRRARPCE